MLEIPSGFVRLIWTGPRLELAAAPWRGNLRAVFRENASRTVVVAYRPTFTVNAITHLEQYQPYLLQVATGFPLDDALASFTSPAPSAAIPERLITTYQLSGISTKAATFLS